MRRVTKEPSSQDALTPFDLKPTTQSLLSFLAQIDLYPSLYYQRVLLNAIRRYEHIWPRVLAATPPFHLAQLAPPLDVQWVWYCHLLHPRAYHTDTATMYRPSPAPPVHPLVHSSDGRDEAAQVSERMWQSVAPDEPFRVEDVLVGFNGEGDAHGYGARSSTPRSQLSCDILSTSERMLNFQYHVLGQPHHKDKEYVRRSATRYWEQFLEFVRFVREDALLPPYDIQLVWHAHMMHSKRYKSGMLARLGWLIAPSDLVDAASLEAGRMWDRWEDADIRWQQLFAQPMMRPGSMWRGNMTAEELAHKPLLKKAVADAGEALKEIQMKKNVPSLQMTVRDDVNIASIPDVANSDDWIHCTWLTQALSTSPRGSSKPDFVERWSRCGREPLFFGRTRHAILHNRQGLPEDFCTVFEVYQTRALREGLMFPIASAHTLPYNSRLDSMEAGTEAICGAGKERVLVLRIGGEDFATMKGSWTEKFPQVVTNAYEEVRKVSDHLFVRVNSLSSNGSTAGHIVDVSVPTGFSDNNSEQSESFQMQRARSRSIRSAAMYSTRLSKAGQVFCSFDLASGAVQAQNARDVLQTYLMGMGISILFLTMQPWYESRVGWERRAVRRRFQVVGPSLGMFNALGAVGGHVEKGKDRRVEVEPASELLGGDMRPGARSLATMLNESVAGMKEHGLAEEASANLFDGVVRRGRGQYDEGYKQGFVDGVEQVGRQVGSMSSEKCSQSAKEAGNSVALVGTGRR